MEAKRKGRRLKALLNEQDYEHHTQPRREMNYLSRVLKIVKQLHQQNCPKRINHFNQLHKNWLNKTDILKKNTITVELAERNFPCDKTT